MDDLGLAAKAERDELAHAVRCFIEERPFVLHHSRFVENFMINVRSRLETLRPSCSYRIWRIRVIKDEANIKVAPPLATPNWAKIVIDLELFFLEG